jgi:hypothetical protein
MNSRIPRVTDERIGRITLINRFWWKSNKWPGSGQTKSRIAGLGVSQGTWRPATKCKYGIQSKIKSKSRKSKKSSRSAQIPGPILVRRGRPQPSVRTDPEQD